MPDLTEFLLSPFVYSFGLQDSAYYVEKIISKTVNDAVSTQRESVADSGATTTNIVFPAYVLNGLFCSLEIGQMFQHKLASNLV